MIESRDHVTIRRTTPLPHQLIDSSFEVTTVASIYKRKQDKHNRRAAWYIGYNDHTGRRRTVKGYTDKGETERYAARLEEDARLIRDGLKAPTRTKGSKQKLLLSKR